MLIRLLDVRTYAVKDEGENIGIKVLLSSCRLFSGAFGTYLDWIGDRSTSRCIGCLQSDASLCSKDTYSTILLRLLLPEYTHYSYQYRTCRLCYFFSKSEACIFLVMLGNLTYNHISHTHPINPLSLSHLPQAHPTPDSS